MDIPVIDTDESPSIRIRSDGELIVKGNDDLQVSVKSPSPEDVRIHNTGNQISIASSSDLRVSVPRDADVTIEGCSGDAIIKGLEGKLTVQRVDGNLTVKSIGELTAGFISGNLEGKNIEGLAVIERVDGNITLRNLEDFQVTGRVSGNLSLADVNGDASARSDGNITLRIDPQPGSTYTFSASGNLVCRLPEDASALLNIKQTGGQMRVKVGEVDISRSEARDLHVEIGDAEAQLTLSADGSLMVLGQAPEWEMSEDFDADFGEEFEGMAAEISEQAVEQAEAQMEALSRQLEAQLAHLNETLGAAGVSAERAARISEQAREASQRATQRAQEKMRHAQEKIRRKMEQAQRKAEARARKDEARYRREERRSAGRSWSFDSSSTPPQPPPDPVSEEERLMILRMLAEKKISMDEAEKLLSALEGESK